jgi:hypothetical protein
MKRIAHCTLAAALITLAFAACRDAVGPPTARSAPSMEKSTTASLLEHVVDPQETDESINWQSAVNPGLTHHYVWLDKGARSNHELLVFLPAGNTPAANYKRIGKEAAVLGYRVIVLMYPNEVKLVDACPDNNSDAAGRAACYENARLEILDGLSRTAEVGVDVANSIDNRLVKLLRYLHGRYPEEGWAQFLEAGLPKWRRIAVAGHSQGGGEAAMIAKLRVVARVVLFSAAPDSLLGAAPGWLSSRLAPTATPSDRYYGLAHDCDGFFPSIVASWDSLGMRASVSSRPLALPSGVPARPGTLCRSWESTSDIGPVNPELIASPYDGRHMLITDLRPQSAKYDHRSSHHSTANDALTPLDANGTAKLLAAWRYLMTASAHPVASDDGEDDRDSDGSPLP